MPKIDYIYCDSDVFLSYFNEIPERVEIIEQLFEEISQDAGKLIITSTLSIVEVANIAIEKEKWKALPNIEEKFDLLWRDSSLVKLIEFQEFIARKARKLMRNAINKNFALKGPDAIHIASAEFVDAMEMFSYDKKLPRYSAEVAFTIREPYVQQRKLFSENDFEESNNTNKD